MLKIMSQNMLGGPAVDRSLESFRTELEQLKSLVNGIWDEQAKAEIQPVVEEFYEKMKFILKNYHSQGVGYSQGYEPNPNPLGQKLDIEG